ncbi:MULTISPECIES: M23 family metallopeptidase [unclassified Acinetobacter]|uniref:M23 family metallopeptidase n=1 Tax=unclassified Acinetobacter TaxID=196816 RepID=UPI002577D181|nr:MULTISPECIES: M23 family metallopeptidase [unclassified Acinetobacter]MDM1765852.1 M23 family metallopeptidase [Acinetobacter sp. 226-1]MDM1769590.1 M23 family metallopeptidase [Acinetobacter sp. 226-4]
MSFYFRYSLIACFAILISACTTTPKKPSPLPQNTILKLKSMSMPNRLPIPVEGIKAKNLTDTWGASRSAGRSHEGIDIMAPRGTKVYSTTEGLVTSLKGNNLGGTVIWIMGPSGAYHYYAHLNGHKRGLKEGDYIKKGTLIGYVGNTGNARHTAPHLHYGLYLNGKGRGAVNPYPYLR